MEISASTAILLIFILGYIIVYVGSRKYLEDFTNSTTNNDGRFHADGSPNTNPNASLPENPYSMQPADEYEISAVFQNRGSREASKQQISDAMTRYPIDWSVQGPDSEHFQENQVQYTTDTNYATQPAPFSKQGTESPVPESQEEEERKILRTYQPKSSKDLLTYSVDDVKHLLDKVYDKKGLIPVIHKSKQGENIWEVTEVKEKNPKIVWEDDSKDMTRERMDMRGEEQIEVPYTASDLAAGMNPFLNARERVRNGRSDSQQWTPGVDRMFATNYPIPEWE
jgi:hypothetical protein